MECPLNFVIVLLDPKILLQIESWVQVLTVAILKGILSKGMAKWEALFSPSEDTILKDLLFRIWNSAEVKCHPGRAQKVLRPIIHLKFTRQLKILLKGSQKKPKFHQWEKLKLPYHKIFWDLILKNNWLKPTDLTYWLKKIQQIGFVEMNNNNLPIAQLILVLIKSRRAIKKFAILKVTIIPN